MNAQRNINKLAQKRVELWLAQWITKDDLWVDVFDYFEEYPRTELREHAGIPYRARVHAPDEWILLQDTEKRITDRLDLAIYTYLTKYNIKVS